MQVKFERKDGTKDVAYITTKSGPLGYRGYVKIGVVKSLVTPNMTSSNAARKYALDVVEKYAENSISH